MFHFFFDHLILRVLSELKSEPVENEGRDKVQIKKERAELTRRASPDFGVYIAETRVHDAQFEEPSHPTSC